MQITVCLGDSCHLKGTRQVAETLQRLIWENGLQDEIDLSGTFCMGRCRTGVSVTVDGEYFSPTLDNVVVEMVIPKANALYIEEGAGE